MPELTAENLASIRKTASAAYANGDNDAIAIEEYIDEAAGEIDPASTRIPATEPGDHAYRILGATVTVSEKGTVVTRESSS